MARRCCWRPKGSAVAGAYRGVDLALHEGEILGIAGVIGSGREALCRTLFGFEQPDAGRILVDGAPVRLASPSAAAAHGIGYIPRERRTEGLVLFLPVAANMTLASLERVARGGLIDYRRENGAWRQAGSTSSGSARPASRRSASTSPAAISRRWCSPSGWPRSSRILILDHPTRGLDVGAKEEVYELIRELSGAGIGIILTADTLEETIGLSHTILVMRDGVVTRRFDASPGRKPEQVELIEHMV